jgi:hypothetical protein
MIECAFYNQLAASKRNSCFWVVDRLVLWTCRSWPTYRDISRQTSNAEMSAYLFSVIGDWTSSHAIGAQRETKL